MCIRDRMYAKEVNIVLTWDDRGRDLDLFALTEIVMNNAEKLADSLGTAHIRQRIPDSFAQKEKAEAVRHIEKELYTLPSAVSNCHEGLIMTEAAGIYNEAEMCIRDRFKYLGIKDIAYNQPASLPYPTENPWK